MRTITREVLSTMNRQQRTVIMALLRAQGGDKTTATDTELNHAINMLSVGPRFSGGTDTIMQAMQDLIDSGVIAHVTPAPLSGAENRWRVVADELTYRAVSQSVLDLDWTDILAQMSEADHAMLHFASCLGPWDDATPIHDGTKFVGSAAKLIELGLIDDDLAYAIKWPMTPLNTTSAGASLSLTLRASKRDE